MVMPVREHLSDCVRAVQTPKCSMHGFVTESAREAVQIPQLRYFGCPKSVLPEYACDSLSVPCWRAQPLHVSAVRGQIAACEANLSNALKVGVLQRHHLRSN